MVGEYNHEASLVIVNRATEHTAIVTASYEAKAQGIEALMKLRDARKLVPDVVAIESDPAKYKYVYRKLLAIMQEYSADVAMKSIDEGIIDFHSAPVTLRLAPGVRCAGPGLAHGSGLRDSRTVLEQVGYEIKRRLRDEVGVAMRCNVGISTNRFLAKIAAGLHKPDGLDVITHDNIRDVLGILKLTDLTGIARRNQARLNAVGIYTPLDFLAASEETLRKIVFKSVDGTKWYQRLRGWEVDAAPIKIGRVGRQYVLERFDLTSQQILQRLHHLCESVGWRLRTQGLAARGVYVYAKTPAGYWHACQVTALPFFSNAAIYDLARRLFRDVPGGVREIGIHCYELVPMADMHQLSLFADELAHERAIVAAADDINGRYGERTIVSADTINTDMYISQKIPFGSTRYL